MPKVTSYPGISHTEKNNHPQGRSGSKVMQKTGPATGRKGNVNKTKSGGIFRPTGKR